MTNIKFENYLQNQLKDPEFKATFNHEVTKLESAVTLTKLEKQKVCHSEN